MELSFMNGELLREAPPEGSYKGKIELEVSDLQTLCFFNQFLIMMSYLKNEINSSNASCSMFAHIAFEAFSRVAEDSGCMELFEQFYEQFEEVFKNERK